MSWEIKSKDGQRRATAYSLEYNGRWMEESCVIVTVESPAPIDFQIGDWIEYRGERYKINYDPGKIKSAPQYAKGDAFKYENLKFYSLAEELNNCDFLDVVLNDNQLHFTGLPIFSFYGGVQQLADRIKANLNRAYPNKWTVIVSSEYSGSKELNVTIDSPTKVQGALSILVEKFETYFTIKGRTITIGAAPVPAAHLFKYGKTGGLTQIKQDAESDQAIVTRVRAYGSTRNMPHRYYNSLSGADGTKLIPDNMAVQNLMLPEFPYSTLDPYIDSKNINALGVREGTIFFDGSGDLEEIYPTVEGLTAEKLISAGIPCSSSGALDEIVDAEQMTDNGVGKVNENETQTEAEPATFKVTLKDLGFNIDEYRTSETPTISFKSGMLGGRDFEIAKCEKSGGNYVLELNRVYDDSLKLWFPYSAYNAKSGDKFVLLYIKMPDVYIKVAALRLKEAAEAWLAKNDYSRSIYSPEVYDAFMARQHDEAMASGGKIVSLHDTLKEGMQLLFEDDDLGIDAAIAIDSLTIKEGEDAIPHYEVVLKEEKSVGTIQRMQNKIDSLSAGRGQGSGGYSASQIRSMIDAYGLTRFLSKLKDDRTKGLLSSDKGFEIGHYSAGISGGILGTDATTGDSFAEVARLYVRVKAFLEELTIQKSSILAGKHYITPGGGIKCIGVGIKGLMEVHPTITCEDGTPIALENGGCLQCEEKITVDNTIPEDVYRCYFLSEQDGEKTNCAFVKGDMAISEMFNAKTGTSNKISNHRYWRHVVKVENDAYTDVNGNHYGYIDLSKTECEKGSDVPQAGDEICQFGFYDESDMGGNTRQSAIMLSTIDADAPSIKLLAGIGKGDTLAERFSLNDSEIISFGYDPSDGNAFFNCYGDTFIGDRDGSTFVRYNKETKQLDVKARLNVQSTIGDKSLNEYITSLIPTQEDIEEFVNNILDPKLTGIQNQIDGVIETWFVDGAPTLTNYPASEWTSDVEKEKHLGDLYFDNKTGLAYRFSKNAEGGYYWNDKVDSATAMALAAAKAAQDTADGKRRVFTAQPTAPYDEGDLWVNATYPARNTEKDPANGKYCNDILRCNPNVHKAAGSAFDISDWELASNYTDDTAAKEALSQIAGYEYLKNALSQDTMFAGGLVMSTLISLGYKDAAGLRHTLAGLNGSWIDTLGGKTIAAWYGGRMIDRENLQPGESVDDAATSLIRMDGSGYFSKGAFSWDTMGNPRFGSGVKVDLGNGNSSAIGESIASFMNFISNLSKAFVPANSNNEPLAWSQIENASHIRALKAIYSNKDMGCFGFGGDDGSGNPGGTAYNRLDAWAEYDAAKSGWVLSAALGADLNTRLSAIESSGISGDYATKDWVEAKGYLTAAALGGYATQTWVNSQGFLTSDALGDYATKDWVEFKNYLTSDALNGYATQSWVNAQKYLKESDYASILDTRYYTEDEIDDKLGGYIASSGGIMTGALSFNRPGSRYGFYIEALDDGSMRVNATLDDQYLKGLFTIESETRQFSLYKAYIAESLALDNQSVIYGSPTISDTQRIYLNHEKTVWVRYNATLNAIECSHAIVSHGDVAAFIE